MMQPRKQVLVKWQNLCSEQEQSGQSAAAFCRMRELPESQFYYWKKRVREAGASRFVEVQVAQPHLKQILGQLREQR
jgi:peptide subunit release factor 1 (eRF1)